MSLAKKRFPPFPHKLDEKPALETKAKCVFLIKTMVLIFN